MTYDPFERGQNPVGVTTTTWRDKNRSRDLVVEVWYPATDAARGQDLDPATQDSFVVPGLSAEAGSTALQAAVRDADPQPGPHAAVLLVHGYAGHRRESTFMATHLASHGFVVASADISGSTFPDIKAIIDSAKQEGRQFSRVESQPILIADRQGDIPFLVDSMIDNLDISPDGLGITGASFGGWASLLAPSLHAKVIASAPMCPSGGSTPTYPRDKNYAGQALDFDWGSDVATMFMVADRDSWLPLYGQIELLRSVPGQKRMFVLEQADHNHFVDDVANGHEWLREFTAELADVDIDGGVEWGCIARGMQPASELTDGDKALICWRGLCTAHMDAHLRGSQEAQAFFYGDVPAQTAERAINIVEIRGEGAKS